MSPYQFSLSRVANTAATFVSWQRSSVPNFSFNLHFLLETPEPVTQQVHRRQNIRANQILTACCVYENGMELLLITYKRLATEEADHQRGPRQTQSPSNPFKWLRYLSLGQIIKPGDGKTGWEILKAGLVASLEKAKADLSLPSVWR